MLTLGGGGRIFLVAGPTDMRKSFDGLAGIVRERLQADPMSRDLFFFCNRARNRMKVLVCDESGMWVLAKRLKEFGVRSTRWGSMRWRWVRRRSAPTTRA